MIIKSYALKEEKLALYFPTAYEEWKSNKNSIPNGIFIERYQSDYSGKLKETLINYWKIDKKIVLDDECK